MMLRRRVARALVRVVFILTGTVPLARYRRLTLAALWSHRIPARWSHWTGPPFILLYIYFPFFCRIRRRAHARATLTHVHTRIVQPARASYAAYSFVHIRSRERAHSTAF